MAESWYTEYARIPEIIVEGKRLGRRVIHDSRNKLYPHVASGRALTSQLWVRTIPILDQGNVGSCTGNMMTGALGTAPLYAALPAGHPALDEALALQIYSAAETLDGDGPYPPNDNGSSGPSVDQAAKNMGLISGYTHAFDLNSLLDALEDGPAGIGINWYDCLVPSVRVLTYDLRWVPVEKLEVGDQLIGFDEHIGLTAKYRPSYVVSLGTKPAPAYEIVTDQGSVAVSAHHLFVRSATLTRSGQYTKGRQQWVAAENLQPGDKIAYFMTPYEEDTSWEGGWLSGFFDGEGTIGTRNGNQLNFGQALGPTLDKAVRLLEAKGYQTSVKQYRPADVTDNRGIHSRKPLANIYVRGGYQGALRFLGEVRPERLLTKAAQLWNGKSIRSKGCPCAIIQEIRPLGTEIVHTIGTSTQTLITEGFLSHNSMDSPDSSGLVTISAGATVRGGHEVLCRGKDITSQLLHCDNSWGTGWGVQGSFDMSYSTLERLLSEQGDVTVPLPLTVPAPQPVPQPQPVPPAPPQPAPDTDPADLALAQGTAGWAQARHFGENRIIARDLKTWLDAKGLLGA